MDSEEMRNAYLRATQDDIVTRLRYEHGLFRVAVGVNQNIVLDTIYAQAADEIERLRIELRELRSETQRLTHQ